MVEVMDERLALARRAVRSRKYYSAFPESPSPRVYGETAAAEGRAAFEAQLRSPFVISTPGADGQVAAERSPYGPALDVGYPRVRAAGVQELLTAAQAGLRSWRDAGPRRRLEVCLAILDALHARVFELALAVQHTTGQAFVMAFQAGGTHALDRALEALAYAAEAMEFHAGQATWTKPGRGEPLVLDKTFTVVPRGVALVVGCRTFPTWNSYPGIFASLATGNPVLIKPHPRAVLPLAITAQAAQRVLAEHGFDPHLVTLAAERDDDGLARELATDDRVKIIDYTGGAAFGGWLEEHARQAQVFTEKSGVNPIVIDSCADYVAMCDNIAFTLSLYSGQMCTSSQNLFLPAAGIQTDQGDKSPEEVAHSIGGAIERLLGPDQRAVELLGALIGPDVGQRAERAAQLGRVLVPARNIAHPAWPDATVRTPALIEVDPDSGGYTSECFGPVAFLVRTASTQESVELLRRTVTEHGAMTAAVYSTSDAVLAATRRAALDAGVALSENLTGAVYVNQSAAFSDFHGTGANPAANASYIDLAYVARRFHVVQARRAGPAGGEPAA